jgi:fatty-acyl-CoA synthase
MVTLGIKKDDAYIHLLALFHIADLGLASTVLHDGGKNLLMPEFDPELAFQLIEKERITSIFEFRPMLGVLLEKLDGKNHDISCLEHVC